LQKELEFTGNWFIDLGILGFVNLMEEVYGEEYSLTHEWFYYAFFIFYLKKTTKDWLKRQGVKKKSNITGQFYQEKRELLQEMENIIKDSISDIRLRKEIEKERIRAEIIEVNRKIKELLGERLQKYKSELNKPFSRKDIIEKINSVGIIISEPFFQNLNFLNPSKNKSGKESEVLTSFEDMIFEHKIKDELTPNAFDKTISKFSFSEKEFPNVIMGKIPTIETMERFLLVDPIIPLLSFPPAFIPLSFNNSRIDRFIAFYTPNFVPTYFINRKLRNYLKKARDKSEKEILRLTWQSVIDFLFETKASFSLENMYLIEYEKIVQQELKGVQYIGIPKLQAEFIIDDKIRETLNQKIKVLEKGDRQYQWLLQEFIKNRPLLPIFYRNLRLYFSSKDSQKRRGGDFKNTNALIYAAALDKVIADLGIEKTNLFSNDFFHKSKSVLKETKDTIQRYFSLMFAIRELFSQESVDNKNSPAYRLFSRLKRKQKYPFVNELLKELNRKDNKDEVGPLIKHLFENILANDKTWQSEAIPIIAGLIKGGVSNEE